jgi:hypothetical protein
MTGGLLGRELLARPVRIRGIQLGRPVDLVVDPVSWRVIGLDVRCGDGVLRFLPLAAARVRADEVEVRSALLLLDEGDTSFYRRGTLSLRRLVGSRVTERGEPSGPLADVVVSSDGAITAVELEDGRRLRAGRGVAVGVPGRATAA